MVFLDKVKNVLNKVPKTFRLTVLGVFLLELFSLCAHVYPSFEPVVFLTFLTLFLIVSMDKLFYGLFFILADLVVSSHGYFLSLDLGGMKLSLRIAMFLIVMSIWLLRFIQKREWALFKNQYVMPFIFLGVAIVFGVLQGVLLDNGFSNIFFDMNGYLFLALIFPFIMEVNSQNRFKDLMFVLWGSFIVSVFKVLSLFYLFSHDQYYLAPRIYKWVRDFRVGEITKMGGDFYRIFFQSQAYTMIACFLLLGIFYFYSRDKKLKELVTFIKTEKWVFFGSIVGLSSLLLSLSRSFWVGGVLTLGVLALLVLIYEKKRWAILSKLALYGGVILIVSYLLIQSILHFPIPNKDFQAPEGLIASRALTVKGEAAVSSRWSLLPPLWIEIKEKPVLGHGFGKTVTYKSSDPRVLERTAGQSGEYTTFAFEWGYLDMWLKFGLLGIIIYLWLLWKLFKDGWIATKTIMKQKSSSLKEFHVYGLGLFLGFIAIVCTNGFSPYLNHPLGIGYLILFASYLNLLKKSGISTGAEKSVK